MGWHGIGACTSGPGSIRRSTLPSATSSGFALNSRLLRRRGYLLPNSSFESAEVGVFDVNILADVLDQQFAGGEMDFGDGRHP